MNIDTIKLLLKDLQGFQEYISENYPKVIDMDSNINVDSVYADLDSAVGNAVRMLDERRHQRRRVEAIAKWNAMDEVERSLLKIHDRAQWDYTQDSISAWEGKMDIVDVPKYFDQVQKEQKAGLTTARQRAAEFEALSPRQQKELLKKVLSGADL